MKIIPSTKVQNNFGGTIEQSQTEIIAITMNGRPYAVLMSSSEYKRLTEIEQRFWMELANVAKSCGFMNDEEMNTWVEGKICDSLKPKN